MFEKAKGIAKGGKIAKSVSKATMNTVNWLITQNIEIKTHDTLFICKTYYCYGTILSNPTNVSKNKFINFTGAMNMQSKSILNDWLEQSTGVFGLSEFISELENEVQNFVRRVKESNAIKPNNFDDGINLLKSYSLEMVINDIIEYFDNESKKFKNLIGSQCESMRIAL